MVTHPAPLLLGASAERAKVHCIFIHGRTQSPEDMQEQVIARLKGEGVTFAMPRAVGNSWYTGRATEPLTLTTRTELDHSLAHIRAIVEDLQQRRPTTPLVIGGFSQGACLALEYAMKYGPWQGAMVNFTGCRVGTPQCDRSVCDLDHMPVYLTGSDKDPWIPVEAFGNAVEGLARTRARLRCDILPGRSHEVSFLEIANFQGILIAASQGDLSEW